MTMPLPVRDRAASMVALQDQRDAARQREVEQLALLGTGQEERFDRITRVARTVFGVPIATVVLIDRDQAWLKSSAGLEPQATPRHDTFCDTVVRTGRPVVIEDALADSAYCALPAVAGPPHLRFYAGYPLKGAHGVVVGTFCLYDTEPRVLDEEQRELLASFGGWTQQELLSSSEMQRARAVQEALLPEQDPVLAGYDAAAVCLPAMAVGGDLYDHVESDDGLGFTVADVMGKGIGASIIAATVRAVVRSVTAAAEGDDLGAAISNAARVLSPDLARSDTFVTLFHCHLDGPSGSLRFVDAGHGLTAVLRADGRIDPLRGGGLPLGVLPDDRWEQQQARLEPGDTLLCASDGLLEMFTDAHEALQTAAGMLEVHRSPRDLVSQIRGLIKLAAPLDDVTVVAVRRRCAP